MMEEELDYIANHLTDEQALEHLFAVRKLLEGHTMCEEVMENEIDHLTEENQRLHDAYIRLVKRLRQATPQSLYAVTEADLKARK